MNNSFDLPLPRSTREESLETISRNKLAEIFDPQLFEVRDEIHRDKGIDLTVNSAHVDHVIPLHRDQSF